MQAFFSVFRLRFKMGLTYRIPAYAGMCTQFFWGFMTIIIYQAFYENSVGQQTTSLSQLVSYVWLTQSFLHAIVFWNNDNELLDMITSGDVAYELARPQSLYSLWFAKCFSSRIAGVTLRFPLILLCAFILPGIYRFALPASLPAFLLFLLTLLLGALIVIAYNLISYFIAFYTINGDGVRWLFVIAADFAAGHLVPILLFPQGIQNILYLLPFAYVSDFPFRIYIGNFTMASAARILAVQLLWLVVLIGAGNLLLRAALKKVVVQGG